MEGTLKSLDDVGGAGWPEIARHIVWCVAAMLVAYTISCALNPLVKNLSDLSPMKIAIKTYIGLMEEPPTNTVFESKICWIQFAFSIVTIILWIYKTYEWHVYPAVYWIEFVMCCVYGMVYVIDQLRFQFDPGHIFALNSLVDTFTVVPLLLQGGLSCGYICPKPCWITFSYLRSLRVLTTWVDIESSGALNNFEEFTRALITSLVKFIVIVTVFSGTMFTIETLGEINGFIDLTLTTEMGNTSFFALCYYTVVTISTVGYGDFAPATVLGRLFVIIVILGGVCFFSMETGKIVQIIRRSAEGKGRFTPRDNTKGHVLVIGGGITTGPLSVIESFLKSLTDASHGDEVPEVVLMASKSPEEEMVNLLQQRWATRANIKYLWGNPTSPQDLERARIANVEFCFVLADVNAVAFQEDLQNIVRAASVYRQRQQIQMLVMMLEGKHIRFAVQAGIPEPMCAGLGNFEEECFEASDRWMSDYIKGANKELYGLQLNKSYNGMSFTSAAKEVYKSSSIMLIAAQDSSGNVVMNPGSKYEISDSSVFFCIANDEDSLDEIRRDKGRVWLEAYEENRVKVKAAKDLERRKKAASMARPAELALQELKNVSGGDGNEMFDDGPKKKATRRGSTKLAKPGVRPVGAPVGTGPGIIGKLGQTKPLRKPEDAKKKDNQKKKEDEDEVEQELFEHEDVATNEEELEEIVAEGGHIVIVGVGRDEGTLLPQITTIIRQLRTAFLPEALLAVPIVILNDHRISEKVTKFIKSFKRTVYVQGSALKLKSLLKVGADQCSKMLVVSAGNGSHHEPIITDQDAILLLSMLESQEPLWGRLPTVICQLHVPANIKQLSESLFSDVQPSGVTLSSCHGTPRKSAGEEAMSPTPRSLTRREPKKTTKSSTHIRTHLRYASGAIIHRAEFSSLFAAAYYTPGVLDLLKSMCQPPQSPYSSIVWKIPSTPEMDGKTFSDVFEEMVGVDAIPIGLQRQASARNGNSAAIVYTCPDPNAKVNKGDGIYVLASTEWAGNNTKYTASCLHVDAAHGHHGATTTAMGAHSLLPGDPLAAMSDGEAALSGAEEIVRRRDGPLRCPSNHKLKELTTPDEGWACDLCAADDLAAGTVLWGCRKCKWVCCKDCYEANSGLEDEARLPLTSLTTRTAAAQGPGSNINIPSAPGLASTLEAPQKSSSSELEGVNPSRGGHDSSLQIGEGNRSRLLGGSMDLADVKPETSAISIPPAPVSSGADGLLGGLGVLGSGLINFGKT